MKKFFLLLGALCLLWSCSSNDQANSPALLSGVITSAQGRIISLSAGSFLDSTTISKDGSFSFQLPVETEETAILVLDDRFISLMLQPEQTLTINSSFSGFPDKIEFGGDLGPVNKYLQLSRKLDQQTAISQDELYILEPDRFIALTDSIRDVKIQLLKEYVMRYPEIDSSFVTRHKADILYAWATQRLIYPGYYALLNKKIPKLPDQYHSTYLQKTEINNPDLLVSPTYQGFLEDYLDYRQAVYLKDHPEVNKLWFPESVARFRIIQQEFTDTLTRDYVLYTSMNDHLDNFGTEHLETFLTNFQLNCHNEIYQNLIDLKLEKLKKLERGQPAPAFTAFDLNDEKVSLSDFEGSLLYINLWATWSPWSLQEFPYWESLIRKFEGSDIKFISISLDFVKDTKNWKYIIEKKQLNGIHLIQDPNSSVWQDEYFISDLPRYLLIDEAGNIISVHAPRPSENMEAVLDRLKQKE